MSFKLKYSFMIMNATALFMILVFNMLQNPLKIKKNINGRLKTSESETNHESISRNQSIGFYMSKLFNQSFGWQRYCKRKLKNNLSFATYADKLGVKKIVREYSLNISIPETYAYVTDANDITVQLMKSLPSKYVLKANHGSQMTVIVKDNLFVCIGFCKQLKYYGTSKEQQMKFLVINCKKWLMTDFGKVNKERFYSQIQRKCFFEEMISQNDDYKIHCFHGKPAIIEVYKNRLSNHSKSFYTPSWSKINMYKSTAEPTADVKRPINLVKMLEVAKQLSREFAFIRVDLYVGKQAIVFSELTFAPSACLHTYSPLIADKFYGLLAAGDNLDPEIIISLLK